MKEILNLEKSGNAIVIRPESSLSIGKSEKNPDKLEEVYNLGRKVCLDRLSEIKKFLNE